VEAPLPYLWLAGLAGLALGALLGAWLAGRAGRARLAELRRVAEAEAESARAVPAERARLLEAQLERERDAARSLAGELRALAETGNARAVRIQELETQLAAAARGQAENEARLTALVADTEKRFTDAFRSLAGQILEEKTARFTETNRTRMEELLAPFRERLKDFQKKIEDTHLTETAERRSLKDELKRLMDLNQQVSQDAKNLTSALKGDAKTQGNWGEMILERVLEMSGLTRDREYQVQPSLVAEDGSRQQPDVVIRLPENRCLVVDSKVSLVAFERYASATDDETRAAALRDHLLSLQAHIRSLSAKNYPALYQLESLDFVLMFVPVEPAFLVAVQADPSLYETAWRSNIVLVSPTTLMATARVVDSVWRLERQNRNVLKIAKQAGDMHDQFVAFLADLEKAARQVRDAGSSLDSAIKRLHTGRGNLVKRADDIRRLGAKASKSLPEHLLEQAGTEPDEAGEPPAPPIPGETDPDLRH
jgi:DNA recombination protein RmuC